MLPLALILGMLTAPASAAEVSPGGLYNAGNAAARAGEVGPAVLAYEQSLALDPRNAATAANLALVRKQAELPTPEVGRLLRWARQLPLRWWLALGAIGGWLAVGALVFAGQGHLPRWLTVSAVTLGVVLGAGSGAALAGYHFDREAVIVLADDTPLQVAPAASADRAAFARAGERAVRLSIRESYTEIRLPDGRHGWAPTARVGSVWGR